jgi:hypothetical protein
MLTIFAVPKPFRGHIGIIQWNAIQSWVRLRPKCEIILLGDEEGVADVATTLDIKHEPCVARNEWGTPLVNSVFKVAESAASFPKLCYVNADILLLSDFLPALQVTWSYNNEVMMVGRRWDLDVVERLQFTADWEREIGETIRTRGRRQSHGAIDYFAFPKGIWEDIPPFAIGRFRWDNWLLYDAISRKIPVVEMSEYVVPVHQNHNYSFHLNGGTVMGNAEVQRNLTLAKDESRLYTLLDVPFHLTTQGIRRRWNLYGLYRGFVSLSRYLPGLTTVVKILRTIRAATVGRAYLARLPKDVRAQ